MDRGWTRDRTLSPRIQTTLVVIGLAVGTMATALCSTSCGFLDTFRIETVEYTFTSADLPPAFDGLRAAFVSDIHRGPFYSEAQVGRLVDRINSLRADIVLLGGDYVYSGTKYESSCFAQLSRLDAPLGCFAVLGNHDYGRPDSSDPGPGSAISAAAEAGIPLLINSGVWLEREGRRIRLGGVADFKADRSELEPIVQGTNANDFVLLLSHNPDFAEDLPPDSVDLVMSGHLHGGQLTIFGIWAPDVRSAYGQKYRTGLVKNEATTVIVSNGISTSTPLPIRVYAPAQVVVLTLRSAGLDSVQP